MIREGANRFRTLLTSVALGALPLVVVLGLGCGSEDFLPSTTSTFAVRTAPENILVLDENAPEMKEYQRIGIGMVKAKSPANGLDGCRQLAADHGGDGITVPAANGPKRWKCLILRHREIVQE